MPNSASPALDKRRLPLTPYVAIWAALALGAAGYIGWVATHPELVARNQPAPSSPGESNRGQRAMSDALAEVKALKDSVGEVQRDVAQLKTDISSAAEHNAQLGTRLTALEEKPGKASTAATAPVPASSAAGKSAEAKPAPALPKILNTAPEPVKSLETGSVAASATPAVSASADAAPIVFGPAIVKPAAKPVGIQIATGPSVDSLRLSWSLLADRHAETLKNLEARYIVGKDAEGTTYGLVAGPMKSSSDAKRVCASLEAKSVPCKVGDFKGDTL